MTSQKHPSQSSDIAYVIWLIIVTKRCIELKSNQIIQVYPVALDLPNPMTNCQISATERKKKVFEESFLKTIMEYIIIKRNNKVMVLEGCFYIKHCDLKDLNSFWSFTIRTFCSKI